MSLLSRVLVLLFLSPLALAQTEDLDGHNKGFTNLTQAGKLFTVTADPQDTLFRFFVSGKEAAKVDFNKTEVVAEYGLGEDKTTVVLTKVKDKSGETFFTLDKPKGDLKDLNLEVQSGDRSEKINFPKLK
ncbi:MAG: hypothetical protein AAF202_00675 [Pseudomonadota bacterium]